MQVDGAPLSAGRVRRALVLVIVLASLGAGAVAILWQERMAIAEWWLVRRAAALGLGPVALRVASLDRDGIAIESIAIGAAARPDLAVDRIDADWTLASLRAGRFTSLRVRGATLRGRFYADGLSFGAIDALGKQRGVAASAPVLPAPEIALDASRVAIDTARGRATGAFGGALHEKDAGLDGAFSLDLAGAGLTARGRLALGGSLAEPSFRLRLAPLRVGELALSLDVRGRVSRAGVVALEAGSLGVAGGALRVGRVTLDPRAHRMLVPLRVEDVDLAALLALAAVEGLDATGRIAGDLPLVREGGALRVDDGRLHATGAGTIRYAPSASVRNLAASRPADLGIAIEAFSDFHYEVLEATVDGDLAGALAIGLHVRGANPAFQDGRPVELNLGLESALADLVRAEAAAYRLPERVEKRVREKAEGR